jgi:hypothetical protein
MVGAAACLAAGCLLAAAAITAAGSGPPLVDPDYSEKVVDQMGEYIYMDFQSAAMKLPSGPICLSREAPTVVGVYVFNSKEASTT